MGLKKAYDKLTDNPEFTEGLTISKGKSVQDHNQRDILKAWSGNPSLYYHSDGTLIGDKVGDFTAIAYRSSESASGTLELTNAQLDIAGDARTVISKFDGTGNHWIKGPAGTEPSNLALSFVWDSVNNEFTNIEVNALIDASSVKGTHSFENGNIRVGALGGTKSAQTFEGVSNTLIAVGNTNVGKSGKLTFKSDNGETAELFAENGELKAKDDAGNTTTLT